MSQIDYKYVGILEDIMTYGYDYEDPNREGVKRKELEYVNIKHLVQEGFPIVTARKTFFKGAVGELLLFLKGSTDVRDYHRYGIHFWDNDVSNYEGKHSKYPISQYKKWCENNKRLNINEQEVSKFHHEVQLKTDSTIIKNSKGEEYIILENGKIVELKKYHLDKAFPKEKNISGIKDVVFEFENIKTSEIAFVDNIWEFIKDRGLGKNAKSSFYWLLDGKLKTCKGWKCNSFSPKKYDMGKIYGHQYKQQYHVFDDFKENPLRTDLIVNSWQIQDLKDMCLKPCHYSYQITGSSDGFMIVYSMRSVDFLLGQPINIQFYYLMGMLLEFWSGHKFNGVIGSLAKVHLYDNQFKLADQIIKLPTTLYKDGAEVTITLDENLKDLSFEEFIKHIKPSNFKLENYEFAIDESVSMLAYNKLLHNFENKK